MYYEISTPSLASPTLTSRIIISSNTRDELQSIRNESPRHHRGETQRTRRREIFPRRSPTTETKLFAWWFTCCAAGPSFLMSDLANAITQTRRFFLFISLRVVSRKDYARALKDLANFCAVETLHFEKKKKVKREEKKRKKTV